MANTFKVNKRSTRHCSGICIVKLQHNWHVILVFFSAGFEHINVRSIALLYDFNQNVSMRFRVGSRCCHV